MPIVAGMTMYDGDRIVTEDGWGEVLIAGSQELSALAARSSSRAA